MKLRKELYNCYLIHIPLIAKTRQTTLHLKRITCEVYKSLNKLNPAFMTDMFEERNIFYDLRHSSVLTQPILSKTILMH